MWFEIDFEGFLTRFNRSYGLNSDFAGFLQRIFIGIFNINNPYQPEQPTT